jgi:protein TonB
LKYFYFALSLLLHGAIVAAIVSYFRRSEERQEEMIFVEIVEESQLPANKSEEQKQEQEKEEEIEVKKIKEIAPATKEPLQEMPAKDEPPKIEDTTRTEEAPNNQKRTEEERVNYKSEKKEIANAEPKEITEKPSPCKAPSEDTNIPAKVERAKVISEPKAIGRIEPVYPRSARRRGREGIVTIEAAVEETGQVGDVAVVATSGHDDLDSAAIKAVRKAKFVPANDNGQSVAAKLRLTFNFRLK